MAIWVNRFDESITYDVKDDGEGNYELYREGNYIGSVPREAFEESYTIRGNYE